MKNFLTITYQRFCIIFNTLCRFTFRREKTIDPIDKRFNGGPADIFILSDTKYRLSITHFHFNITHRYGF